jgi:HK97 gp10 family phage protein
MNVTFKDNSAEILKAFEQATERALEKIGLVAEGYAKKLTPVDTGRLRNSITHEVDGNDVYIGSNVEYAPYVELGTSKQKAQPYLKPAATEHTETYKNILKTVYENA